MLTDPTVTDKHGQPLQMPLKFTGTIRLSDLEENLVVRVPPQLVGRYFGSKAADVLTQLFPDGWAIPLKGRSTAVKPQWGDMIVQIAKKIEGGKLKGLLGEGVGKVGN